MFTKDRLSEGCNLDLITEGPGRNSNCCTALDSVFHGEGLGDRCNFLIPLALILTESNAGCRNPKPIMVAALCISIYAKDKKFESVARSTRRVKEAERFQKGSYRFLQTVGLNVIVTHCCVHRSPKSRYCSTMVDDIQQAPVFSHKPSISLHYPGSLDNLKCGTFDEEIKSRFVYPAQNIGTKPLNGSFTTYLPYPRIK